MKNSIINSSFIVLLVMAVGCSEANPDAELDLGVESDLTLNATQDTCCGISYEVYDTTVMMWEQSWKWANPAATPPNYVLSEDKFNSLYIEGAEGVRVYYGLMPETTIPILVIVNIDKCDDLTTEEGTCLIVGATNYFEDIDVAQQYVSAWSTYIGSKVSYVDVRAYNYSWTKINELFAVKEDLGGPKKDEVSMTFGLRTVSPSEFEYGQENTIKHGSIAYVNISHGGETENGGLHDFDFTMPCPQKCGVSVFYED